MVKGTYGVMGDSRFGPQYGQKRRKKFLHINIEMEEGKYHQINIKFLILKAYTQLTSNYHPGKWTQLP